MSGLRGSTNFIWDIKHPLGQGATSMVCLGRNKRTGHQVAVKVFSPAGHMRPMNIKEREFDVLKKLDHDNIVRLLAIEEEQGDGNRVLVMELCTGGSLYTLIEDPHNAFGLEEEQFVLVLSHVAAGMKHLRDNDIIHRDIKPGNILRYIGEDGRSVYKLTDFGAARELQDEEQFMSLYGTEEYLHPDLYERAVLRGQNKTLFGAAVDLWSLGATFYHTATGQLPFRPFGGRKNRHTMLEITTQKESGVISGFQIGENTPIEWSRELPGTCRLSMGLQMLVTPLLGRLLETDPEKSMPFEDFFNEVKNMTATVIVPILSPSTWQMLKVYCSPTDCISQLKCSIAAQTGIPDNDQFILIQNQPLNKVISLTLPVSAYPSSVLLNETPLVVFPHDTANESLGFSPPSMPNFPKFGSTLTLDTDYPLSKQCLGIMYGILREVEISLQIQNRTHATIQNFGMYVQTRLSQTTDSAVNINTRSEEVISHSETVCQFASQISSPNIAEYKYDLEQTINKLRTELRQLGVANQHIGQQHGRQLLASWSEKKGCQSTDRCFAKLECLVQEASAITDRFKADRSRRTLSYNDEQIHKFEKSNLHAHCTKAKALLTDHCLRNSKLLFIEFRTWLRSAQDVLVDEQILYTSIEKVSQQLTITAEKITQLKTECCRPRPQNGPTEEPLSITKSSSLPICQPVSTHVLSTSAPRSASDLRSASNSVGSWNNLHPPKSSEGVSVLLNSLSSLSTLAVDLKGLIAQNSSVLQKSLRKSKTGRNPSLVDGSDMTDGFSDAGNGDSLRSVLREVTEPGYDISPLELIKGNTPLSWVDKNGLTLLHHAVLQGNVTLVKTLIANSCRCDSTSKLGITPLHLCCIAKDRANAELNGEVTGGDNGRCLINMKETSTIQMALILLKNNADIDAPDVNRNTSLHWAALHGAVSILECMLPYRPNLLAKNLDGQTALHLACREGHIAIVTKLILCDSSVNLKPLLSEKDVHGNTALHIATKMGNIFVVKQLLNVKANVKNVNNRGATALILACKKGHAKIALLLLDKSADVHICDRNGRNVAHYAASIGNRFTDVMAILIQRGVAVNIRDKAGRTPLHYACRHPDSNETVDTLLAHDAQPTLIDNWCRTPLHEAAAIGDVGCVRALLTYGARTDIADNLGRTAFLIAESKGHDDVMKELQIHGQTDL